MPKFVTQISFDYRVPKSRFQKIFGLSIHDGLPRKFCEHLDQRKFLLQNFLNKKYLK